MNDLGWTDLPGHQSVSYRDGWVFCSCLAWNIHEDATDTFQDHIDSIVNNLAPPTDRSTPA